MLSGINKNLMPEIAGQALSSAAPQGLSAQIAGVGAIANPAFLATLPLTSPRVVGELAYKTGQAKRLGSMANPVYQAGRALRPIQQPLEEQRQGLLNR